MINQKVMIVAGMFLGSSLAIAGAVVGLNTFTAGTPAVANDVNANFTAIKTAVDDNNTRVNANIASLASNSSNIANNAGSIPSLQSASLVRTIVVKPVIGGGGLVDPVASGTALINAVAGITGSSSANNRWLVKLETGVFDLGSQMLTLPDGVSLEGAGRGATMITSFIQSGTAPRSATVKVSGTSSISNLTVKNTVIGVSNAAIAVSGATAVAKIYYVDASGGTAVLTESGATLKVYNSNMAANRIETLWLTSAADSVDVVNTGMATNVAYYIFAGRTMRCFGAHDQVTFAALNNVTCL